MILNEEFLHKIIISEIDQNVRFNPSKAHVYNTFNTINKNCFNGKLKPCNIQMISDRKYLGFFNYDGIKGNKLINPTISVNYKYQYTIKEFESVVAHEMIHYYLAYFGINNHGYEFQSLANKINRTMGLQISDTVDATQMGYNNQQLQVSGQLLGYMNACAKALNQYLPKIKQESNGKNGNLTEFFSTVYEFTYNLINALNRCISKKSLNEDLIQKVLPFKPIDDFRYGFKKYYAMAQNWINGKNGNTTYSNSGTISNTDLIGLLYSVYPKLRTKYQRLGYKSTVITNEFKSIDDLKVRIDAETKNTQ